MTVEEAFHELCCYTLAHNEPTFIHQHVVDAFAAQEADDDTKPITLTFALIGLYLLLEHGFSGKQVQRVHIKLAERKQTWPDFILPDNRGSMTVFEVLSATPGEERDQAIHKWCASVWAAFGECKWQVAALLRKNGM